MKGSKTGFILPRFSLDPYLPLFPTTSLNIMNEISNIDSDNLIEPAGHNLPELLTEIWLAIFRCVTWVPGILDSSYTFDFRKDLSRSWRKHEPLRASLVRDL